MKFSVFLIFITIFIFSFLNCFSEQYIVFLKSEDILKSNITNRIISLKNNSSYSLNDFRKSASSRNIRIIKDLWAINAVIVESDRESLKKLDNIRYFVEDRNEYAVSLNQNPATPSRNTVSWNLLNMNIPKIWYEYGVRGSGITVGIIDTGIDINHAEFSDLSRIRKAWSFGKIINPSELIDKKGHGSHVAGIIAGGNESGQAIGVAPECDLIIARAVGEESVRASDLLEAMQFMLDPDGNPYTDDFADVVNCSWHSSYDYQNPYYEMIELWENFGIIPCFSAGNWGPEEKTITNPKEHPFIFATGAVDKNNEIAEFSSRGPGVFNGEFTKKPDWAAPGVNILSVKSGGGYVEMSGTSMASPHIAGLCALMIEKNPELEAEDIRYILRRSCSQNNEFNEYSKDYGYGIVNAEKAFDILVNGYIVKGKIQNNIYAEIFINEIDRTIKTDKNGNFKLFLPAGNYNFTVKSQGYNDYNQNITVNSFNTELLFKLNKISTKIFSGQIMDSATKKGLRSQIQIKSLDFERNIQTDFNGSFSTEIISGKYEISITSEGYRTLLIQNYSMQTDENVEFFIEKAAEILIVDNDSGKDFDKSYSEILDNNDISFEYKELDDNETINVEQLHGYKVIIWIMGNNIGTRLIKDNRDVLREYTKTGGNLLIAGQDIAIGLRRGYEESDFLENTLKASYSKDKPSILKVYDETLEFELEKLTDIGFDSNSPDVIRPVNGSKAIFTYKDDSGAAGVFYSGEYKVIFLSFGLARIKDKEIRANVLLKSLRSVLVF